MNLTSLLLGKLVPGYLSNLLLGGSSPRIYLEKKKKIEFMNLRIGNPHLHAWSSSMLMRLSLEGASAFLWALQVADAENWMQIVIEGDAKVCVDSLNGKGERVD